jgi:hypothetical protein
MAPDIASLALAQNDPWRVFGTAFTAENCRRARELKPVAARPYGIAGGSRAVRYHEGELMQIQIIRMRPQAAVIFEKI